MIPISYKIQVTVGDFTIMMTLEEVKQLRNKLNEICGSEDSKQVNPFIQYGPGQRAMHDSSARGFLNERPNETL